MKRTTLVASIIALLLAAPMEGGQVQDHGKTIRVGVYDNRAITMAFFDSEYNPFVKIRAERHEAELAGDSARIAELDKRVDQFQCKLHYQGFCRAPVDDILALVRDKLPEVARMTGVDFIGWYPDFIGDRVEAVDITAELTALFNPSEKRREQIEKLKDIEPTPLCEIDHRH